MNTDTLKEYYVKLQGMYNNAVNMLTAINQSLSTTSSEISITIADTDDAKTTVRIPSFIYLENKIEQLSNNFSNLLQMPSSGQAWFSNDNNMYKLQMVQSNIAPVKPVINDDSIIASLKPNTFLKDLVNPRTFLKINIDNVPNNVSEIYVKKLIIFDPNVFAEIESRQENLKSYQDYVAALSNLTEGVEYEEYDTTVAMPIKREEYDSEFRIIEIPNLESGNPYYSSNIENPLSVHNDTHLLYQVRLNTLIYRDHDDPAIEYQLKVGDQLSLEDNFTIYKIKNISKYQDSVQESLVTLEEIAGHTALQEYEANNSMVLKIYKSNYTEYNYVEVPLEENDHIVLFLSLIDSNVRSSFSDPIVVNLNNVYMYNENGTLMKDPKTGRNITYIDYYNQYCTNIGDILQGISDTIYPQFTNINNGVLNTLQSDNGIKTLVTDSINKEFIEVACINNHIFDDESSNQITELYAEKNKYNLSIADIQANIDNTYNLLTTTDFTSDLSLTQESLKSQLDEYYSERTSLNKEYISVVNRIAALKAESNVTQNSKYRIRGFFSTDIVEEFIKANISDKCDLIGIDVEYKYVSVSSNQSSVTQINNNVFTNWNKYKNIDKERILKFDNNNLYTIQYVEHSSSDNAIKWNQVDIPINYGEDVVIRIRYKYSIGQPFMNFYSPWSDNITFEFPEKFANRSEVAEIVKNNDDDVVNAKFMSTLINDGYDEHIGNKIIDNSQVYFHMPENIYSGFNTAENKLISLKDKLISLSNDIDKYKSVLNQYTNENYKVYLEYDNNMIELHNSSDNIINVNDTQTSNNTSYKKKQMNIIIKNIGESAINLYSIFAGNTSVPLLNCKESYINNNIENYQRVPLLISGTNLIKDIWPQTLGQWIYFRQNNPYTLRNVYYDTQQQRNLDTETLLGNCDPEGEIKQYCFETLSPSTYMNESDRQVLLPYKTKTKIDSYVNTSIKNAITTIYTNILEFNGENISITSNTNTSDADFSTNVYDYTNMDQYVLYDVKQQDNKYLVKYSHILGNYSTTTYIDESTDLNTFIQQHHPNMFESIDSFEGMFLYPELPISNHLLCNSNELGKQYKTIPVGNSLSVPVMLEYFFALGSSSQTKSISKSLCFDLKPSLDKDFDHYVIKVIVNKNITVIDSYVESETGIEEDIIK